VLVHLEVVVDLADFLAAALVVPGGRKAVNTDRCSRVKVGIRALTRPFRSWIDPSTNEKNLLIPVGVTLASLASPTLNQAEESDWTFNIAPYFWLASIGAEASVLGISSTGGGGGGLASSVQQSDTKISGGFMVAAQARYNLLAFMSISTGSNWTPSRRIRARYTRPCS
jgi:hypothetical protein